MILNNKNHFLFLLDKLIEIWAFRYYCLNDILKLYYGLIDYLAIPFENKGT